jgi:hypothetical protein
MINRFDPGCSDQRAIPVTPGAKMMSIKEKNNLEIVHKSMMIVLCPDKGVNKLIPQMMNSKSVRDFNRQNKLLAESRKHLDDSKLFSNRPSERL